MSRGNTWKEQRMARNASHNIPTAEQYRKVKNHVRKCASGQMYQTGITLAEFGILDEQILSCVQCGTNTVQISLVREWIKKDHKRFHDANKY